MLLLNGVDKSDRLTLAASALEDGARRRLNGTAAESACMPARTGRKAKQTLGHAECAKQTSGHAECVPACAACKANVGQSKRRGTRSVYQPGRTVRQGHIITRTAHVRPLQISRTALGRERIRARQTHIEQRVLRDQRCTLRTHLAGHSVALVLDVAAPQLEDLQCVLGHERRWWRCLCRWQPSRFRRHASRLLPHGEVTSTFSS